MDIPEIPKLSMRDLQHMLDSLTPEELADFAKRTANEALNRMFSVYNEALSKYLIEYRYEFKIDVRERK